MKITLNKVPLPFLLAKLEAFFLCPVVDTQLPAPLSPSDLETMLKSQSDMLTQLVHGAEGSHSRIFIFDEMTNSLLGPVEKIDTYRQKGKYSYHCLSINVRESSEGEAPAQLSGIFQYTYISDLTDCYTKASLPFVLTLSIDPESVNRYSALHIQIDTNKFKYNNFDKMSSFEISRENFSSLSKKLQAAIDASYAKASQQSSSSRKSVAASTTALVGNMQTLLAHQAHKTCEQNDNSNLACSNTK